MGEGKRSLAKPTISSECDCQKEIEVSNSVKTYRLDPEKWRRNKFGQNVVVIQEWFGIEMSKTCL